MFSNFKLEYVPTDSLQEKKKLIDPSVNLNVFILLYTKQGSN